MKYILLPFVFMFIQHVSAQRSDTLTPQILVVKTKDVILQGNVDFGTNPEMFVGETYYFTIISNDNDWDLKIESNNLRLSLDEKSKKRTGGLGFQVMPLDTGKCTIVLYITNDKGRQVCLQACTYHASKYPMPPVFIGDIRSGEIIDELKESAQLSCKYDEGSGIFKGYAVLSWSAKLGDTKYSGTGTKLSKELIEAINNSSVDNVLKLTVELADNKTGYKTSEAVYLIK